MAVRGSRKRPGRGSKSGAEEVQEEVAKQPESPVEISRAKVRRQLEDLMVPVLDKYGQSAFEELHNRIETIIQEFTTEVESLFTDLVDKANTDHGKLIDLLKRDDDGEDGQPAAPIPDDASLSEYERRLEEMESTPAETEEVDDEGDEKEG